MLLEGISKTNRGRRKLAKKMPSFLRRKSSKSLQRGMSFEGGDAQASCQLQSNESEVDTLNHFLAILSSIFPDVQIEVFREVLLSVSEESRLPIVVEVLLKHQAEWVKGRWRSKELVVSEQVPRELDQAVGPATWRRVPLNEQFRSKAYKQAVKTALYQEFRGLPDSTVDAVLAENNHHYSAARQELLKIAARSWWFSFSSYILRRKRPQSQQTPQNHPLVTWLPAAAAASPGSAASIPAVKATGSEELDQEISQAVVQPLQDGLLQRQLEQDRDVAARLNETEAEANHALHDCECCFMSTTFEQLCACDHGRHLICLRCTRHAVSEAVFGQSWHTNVDSRRGTLRCLAPSLNGGDDCDGHIAFESVRRALLDDKDGAKMLRRLEEKLAADALNATNLPLMRCPFCPYAEVDDLDPTVTQRLRLKPSVFFSPWTILAVLLACSFLPLLLPFSLIVLLTTSRSLLLGPHSPLQASRLRISRRRRSLRFACRSPWCGQRSCVRCAKAWTDPHVCFESERASLRAHVERAMVEAIKRTCPRCHVSFVKSSGCNKLTCPCGYSMCYVCRAAIAPDGYRHFCEHFRPSAEPRCGRCNKCDLYRCEDEDVAVARAAQRAELQWTDSHPGVLGGGDCHSRRGSHISGGGGGGAATAGGASGNGRGGIMNGIGDGGEDDARAGLQKETAAAAAGVAGVAAVAGGGAGLVDRVMAEVDWPGWTRAADGTYRRQERPAPWWPWAMGRGSWWDEDVGSRRRRRRRPRRWQWSDVLDFVVERVVEIP